MTCCFIFIRKESHELFKNYIYLILIFFICNSLSSQEDLGDIVVTPNRSLVELNKVGSSVLLINKRQIDSSASTTTSGIYRSLEVFQLLLKEIKALTLVTLIEAYLENI